MGVYLGILVIAAVVAVLWGIHESKQRDLHEQALANGAAFAAQQRATDDAAFCDGLNWWEDQRATHYPVVEVDGNADNPPWWDRDAA